MDSTEGRHKRVHALIFVAILAVGIFVRIWHFGTVPGGLNQDEAFAGYEAWSLLKYGVDSAGYRFPVYLTAWGSGMNALNSYLMMPFIAIFGLKVWVIRLPQLIVACLTIPAVYGVVRRLSGGQPPCWRCFFSLRAHGISCSPAGDSSRILLQVFSCSGCTFFCVRSTIEDFLSFRL